MAIKDRGNWREARLGDVCEYIVDCLHGKKPERSERGRPFLQVFNIGRTGRIDTKGLWLIKDADFIHWRKRLEPSKYDILITKTGRVGEIAQILDDEEYSVGRNIVVIRPHTGCVDPIYLRFFMLSPEFRGEVLRSTTDGTILQSLHVKYIADLNITLPPLHEQRAIAHILGTLDDKIELNRRMNQTLEEMARALFKSWFVDFDPVRAKMDGRWKQGESLPGMPAHLWELFPDKLVDSELGEIPEGWTSVPVFDLAVYVNGAAYKAFQPNGDQRGLPIIKIAELKAGVTSQTKFSEVLMPEKYRLKTGDILFSWSGNPDTSIDTFVWCHGPAWLNQHIFRVEPIGRELRSYVLATLKYLRTVFAEIARNKQTTGLGHVTVGDMKQLLVIKPDARIIAAWNSEATPLFQAVFRNEMEALTLARIRDTLLPKLISGELRVKDAEQYLGDAI